MPNPTAVAFLAERLPAGLVHPGDGDQQPAKSVPMPWLSNLGLPPGQAEQFTQEAGMPTNDAPKVYAEAIEATMAEGGWKWVRESDLEEMRASAATLDDVNPQAPMVEIYCRRCRSRKPILNVAVGRARVMMDGKALRKQLDDVCGCG